MGRVEMRMAHRNKRKEVYHTRSKLLEDTTDCSDTLGWKCDPALAIFCLERSPNSLFRPSSLQPRNETSNLETFTTSHWVSQQKKQCFVSKICPQFNYQKVTPFEYNIDHHQQEPQYSFIHAFARSSRVRDHSEAS